MDGRDTARDGPAAISPSKRRRAALRTAVLTFLVVLAGAMLGVQILPTRYAATSVVSFMPRLTSLTSADTVQLLGQKYVVLATSATIMQTAGDAIQAPPEDLVRATTAVLDAGTGNLEITVLRPSRQQAVDAANAVADVLVRRSRYDDLVQAESTSPAVASRAESRPARLLLRCAASVAAVLAGLLVWTLVRGRPGRGQPDSGLVVSEGSW